mgnify:CR=1 FL=1
MGLIEEETGGLSPKKLKALETKRSFLAPIRLFVLLLMVLSFLIGRSQGIIETEQKHLKELKQ